MATKLLTEADIRAAVPMARAIEAVRIAFQALAAGEFELPLRTVLGDGRFLTMSARHVPSNTAVVKAVGVDLERRPAVDGAVVFLAQGHADTLVLEAEAVTALRTGAVTGVATDALAPPDACRLTLIGLGGQAPDQLRAVRAVRTVERVTLVARRPASGEEFRERYSADLRDVEVVVARSVTAAVGDADVVCCATPSTEPLFAAADLADRVHVNAVGSYRPAMRELPDELLADSLVVVDDRTAALAEAGEIKHAITARTLTGADLIELGPLLRSAAAPPPRTVFKSVGLAIQDWAIGHALHRS